MQLQNLSPGQIELKEDQIGFDDLARTANLSSKSALDSYGANVKRQQFIMNQTFDQNG